MDLKCDKCGEVKPAHELAKWNIDGETICKECHSDGTLPDWIRQDQMAMQDRLAAEDY